MRLTHLPQMAAWLDDQINPIVVKELRQAVRSRLVVFMLMVFLLVLVTIIGFCLLAADHQNPDFYLGRSVFMGLQSIVLGAGLLFVPVYTGVRLAMEQSRANMALLYITTLRPRSIIAGKILASAVLTLLIYSICLPFLTITYLLRGIDVPTIFLVVTLHLWIIFSAVTIAIFIASLPIARIMQWLLGLCYLIALLITFSTTAVWTGSMVYEGVGSMILDPEFWTIVLLILFKTALAAGLLISMSVAMISPTPSNRALAPRLYVTAAWGISLAGTLIGSHLAPSTTDFLLIFWIIEQVMVLSLGMLIVTCEPDQLGLRLQATLPQSKLKRSLFMLFYTGSGGGIIWCVIMFALTLLVGQQLYTRGHGFLMTSQVRTMLMATTAFSLYVYDYGLSGVFLRRITQRKTNTTIAFTLGLLILGMIVPIVIAFLINPLSPNYSGGWWLLASPMGIFYDESLTLCLWITAFWAMAATVINGKWFIKQAREFLSLVPAPITADPA